MPPQMPALSFFLCHWQSRGTWGLHFRRLYHKTNHEVSWKCFSKLTSPGPAASQSDALQRRRHLPWRIHSWRWTEIKSLSFPLPSYFCTFKNMSPHSLCSCSETTHPTSSSMNSFPFWSGSNKPLQKKGSLPCLGCLLVHNRVQGWQTIPHGPNPAQYQFCV